MSEHGHFKREAITPEDAWARALAMSSLAKRGQYPLPREGEFVTRIGLGDGKDTDMFTPEDALRFAKATGRTWTTIEHDFARLAGYSLYDDKAPGKSLNVSYQDRTRRSTKFVAVTPDQLAYSLARNPNAGRGPATAQLAADMIAYYDTQQTAAHEQAQRTPEPEQ